MQPKYMDADNDARLNSGIVFYKGEPYVFQLVSKIKASLIYLKEYGINHDSNIVVSTTDKNLDISSPELGYINFEDSTVYVRRTPARKYKQALSSSTCTGRYPNGSPIDTHTLSALLYSKHGYEMLTGKYPSYDEALKKVAVGKSTTSCAFSRDCAVCKGRNGEIEIHIKGEKVGTYSFETGNVKIVENPFSWVTERILMKHNIKIG